MSAATPEEAVRVTPLGDRALVVGLGDRIGELAFQRVRAAVECLDGFHPAITDLVAGFTSVTVHYDPSVVARLSAELPHVALTQAIGQRLRALGPRALPQSRLVEIAVCYAADFAPDLEEVARHAALPVEAAIALHSSATYSVHMIGFAPGFPYLAGLDARLATPRRAEPRTRVAAGSVGIGGEQTGIYPITTPGGWNIIGRTPLVLFDARRDPAVLLHVGDRVRFVPISRDQFDAEAGV